MGVEIQAPCEASTNNHEAEQGGGGSHYCQIGIKILAPHSVFSDNTPAEKGLWGRGTPRDPGFLLSLEVRVRLQWFSVQLG